MQALIAALLAGVLVHLLTTAASGNRLGAHVFVIAFGFGPVLFRRGRLKLALLPLGGYVQFDDPQQVPPPGAPPSSTLDKLPLWRQLAITLSGCAALLLLACACLGREGLQAFALAPGQILAGALSPLGEGHRLLAQVAGTARSATAAELMGLVAAKLAALNLLPLPPLNGGAALGAIGRRLGSTRWLSRRVFKAGMLLLILLQLSWALALLTYAAAD